MNHSKKDIFTIAAESVKTLAVAVTAAGLEETLKGKGFYSVFAPTDAAFVAIQKNVDNLLKPKNKSKLADILNYHVVSGESMAADLKNGQVLTTLQGGILKVSIKRDKIKINNAHVTMSDLKASNGVVHVIDKVLIPKM